MPRNTIGTTAHLGDKCQACGITGLHAMSLASLDRLHGCMNIPGKRHHFPWRKQVRSHTPMIWDEPDTWELGPCDCDGVGECNRDG